MEQSLFSAQVRFVVCPEHPSIINPLSCYNQTIFAPMVWKIMAPFSPSMPEWATSTFAIDRHGALVLLTLDLAMQDDRLALIHIPLDVYPFFLQPILQLLFHDVPPMDSHSTNGNGSSATALPGFLNISVTPVECSVVCSRVLANRYFVPLLQSEPWNTSGSTVEISAEDFIVMQVDGQGLDAGQRVLELTSPLAMAGVWVDRKPPDLLFCWLIVGPGQFHILYLDILLRLYPIPSTCQKASDSSSRKPRLSF
jgi:hypothetical protein